MTATNSAVYKQKKPKIKKLPVIECWAFKFRDGWMVTSDKWLAYQKKRIKGTFIPHKEGKHG